MPDRPQSRLRVGVVGGGIAGLAAAQAIATARADVEVEVLEASPQVGGKVRLGEVGGVTLDVGAEAMLARRPEAIELSAAVGLAEDLVHPVTTTASLWNRGELVPLPRTLMGVPIDVRALDRVLSPKGLARAAMDGVLPATELGERDISIGDLVEERFGREVVDRLVEPLLGGVYAGHARDISARAAVPQVVALLDRDRSLARAAAEALPTTPDPAPIFAGLRGGVGRLPLALAATPGVTVRTNATVRDLARRAGGGWNVVVGPTSGPEVHQYDAVVVAAPATPAARLLSDVTPRAALALARIEYASMAIVSLAFRERDLPEVVGSGFLVPPVDGHAVKAATYSFAKWEWVQRAGNGLAVLRCSLGRHGEERTLQADDAELVTIALTDLSEAIGVVSAPVDTHVQRWGGALPQYAVGHLDRVAEIRADIAAQPGLAVCGAAYEGLGIPACIASAQRAAREVLGDLPEPLG